MHASAWIRGTASRETSPSAPGTVAYPWIPDWPTSSTCTGRRLPTTRPKTLSAISRVMSARPVRPCRL